MPFAHYHQNYNTIIFGEFHDKYARDHYELSDDIAYSYTLCDISKVVVVQTVPMFAI